MTFKNLFQNRSNILAAHRGARDIAPENTLLAFKKAIELKADFIELDVGFSKDGVAIVIHDDTLNRTTDATKLFGEGEHKIIDYNYKDILKLNASYQFITKDPFNTLKQGRVKKANIPPQIVPTLKEVLTLCKEHNMLVNVEIKELKKTPFHEVAVDRVLKIIEQTKMQELVLISSFNHSYLKEIKSKSNLPIGVLQEEQALPNAIEYLTNIQALAYNCEKELVNKELISELKQKGIFTNIFTINDKKEQQKLFNMGVKAIFTDCL